MSVALEDFDRDRDRRDPERARRLFALLWPDPAVQAACADRLAQSIRHAHGRADASWEVTMFAGGIRLNVGQVEVLSISAREVKVVFRRPFDTRVDKRLSLDRGVSNPVYRAVPVTSGICRFAPRDLGTVPRTLWTAHEAFIDAAADAKKVSPFKRSFSDGVLRYVESLLGGALPRPTYFGTPDKDRVADNWRGRVRSWVRKSADSSNETADSIERFFERAFESTRVPEHAWFGVHQSRLSLVVGGVFLAAVLRSGKDRGVWLLVDQDPPPVEGVKYHAAKSTKRSTFPLVWAHSPALDVIRKIVASDAIWQSFSAASEKILQAGIGSSRDELQERRGKVRLSEISGTTSDRCPGPIAHPIQPRPHPPMAAGFGDPEQNRNVEQAAVRIVAEWYQGAGWQVTSVEAQRCGFDLLCTRDGTEAHIEVKGSAGNERRFIVTAGELRHAKSDSRFVLALVTNALSERPALEYWTAARFHEQFDFEPIQYWAIWKAKQDARSLVAPTETDAEGRRGSSA